MAGVEAATKRPPALQVLAQPDFRWLWVGAFISFLGGQVQNVAQGYLVYDLTNDKAALGLVWFCAMMPVSFLGPFLGVLADTVNRRWLMAMVMVVSSAGSILLGMGARDGWLAFQHILLVATVLGTVQAVEPPVRQSIVQNVVPPHLLATAVPMQAMAFNGARVLGPALGGLLAARLGAAACFFINGVSFFALLGAVFLIKTDLSPLQRKPQPILDLIMEGARYTMRHKALRTLFFMESATSVLGMFYLSQMPALARDQLGLDQQGLGVALSFVGVGAITALITLAGISHLPIRTRLVRWSMALVAVCVLLLSQTHEPWQAYPLLFLLGAGQVVQFNTTNALFQLLSPPALRGRVIAMHMWAISGAMPFGVLFFGWYAGQASLGMALTLGGTLLGLATLWAFAARRNLTEPSELPQPSSS